MERVIEILPLALTWAVLIGLLFLVHKILNPHPSTETIRKRIFSAEIIVLSLLFFSFVIIELDGIKRGERPQPFFRSATELLGAFAVSLGVYKVFSRGES